MDTPNAENTSNQDLDDSGCVQDASVTENGYKGQVQLLDLSDDVLLYILKNCSPRDLKALGHTCPRLGALVCDRTLWTRVDARCTPIGQERLRWFLTHCLSPGTLELKLKGYANRHSKCLGIQDPQGTGDSESGSVTHLAGPRVDVEHFLLRMWYPHLPRFAVSPRWPDKEESESKDLIKTEAVEAGPSSSKNSTEDDSSVKASTSTEKEGKSPVSKELSSAAIDCKGPQFTLTSHLLRDLRNKCSNLTSLSLEYCNIDYKSTNICMFPPNLKKLSLRGTLCYNLPVSTSYLGKIQERLPGLEYLDVSECDWFEPASLMPLSKLAFLKVLHMRDCKRLSECVAYASLATRYGFRQLKVLDVRGCPLADSEISALGWLPLLEELYCSPPDEFSNSSEHTHSWEATKATYSELDHWEKEEPEYYKVKTPEPSEDIEDELKEELIRTEPVLNVGGPRERMDDVLLGNPWWLHERRIIVIQPNNDRQAERRSLRTRQVDPPPAPVDPPAAAVDPPVAPVDLAPAAPACARHKRVGTKRPRVSDFSAQTDDDDTSSAAVDQGDQAGPSKPVKRSRSDQTNEDEKSTETDPVDQVAVDQAAEDLVPILKVSVAQEPVDLAPVVRVSEDQEPATEPGPSKRPVNDSQVPEQVKRPRLDSEVQGEDDEKPLSNKQIPGPNDGPASQDKETPEQNQSRNPEGVQANPDPNNGAAAQDRPRHRPRVQAVVVAAQELRPNGPGAQNPQRMIPLRAQVVQLPNNPPAANDPEDRNWGRGIQLIVNNAEDIFNQDEEAGYIRIPVDLPREMQQRDRLVIEQVGRVPPRAHLAPMHLHAAELCPRLRNDAPDEEHRAGYAELRRNEYVRLDVHRPSAFHVGQSGYHLVSDSAICRFGRADNDNVNYVNIGPNGIRPGDPGTRPDRSNLRVLSATGYRNITNRSLVHLATAAPRIIHIDFSQTSVTSKGVEIFKAIRPDCEVIFSEHSK